MRRRAVTPIEVEDVLYAHPAIEHVAVVAKPDPKWGETPIAFVDLKPPLTPGADAAPSEDELIAFARARMPHFKARTAYINHRCSW
jgi:fatty-acyl-CoA synthase